MGSILVYNKNTKLPIYPLLFDLLAIAITMSLSVFTKKLITVVLVLAILAVIAIALYYDQHPAAVQCSQESRQCNEPEFYALLARLQEDGFAVQFKTIRKLKVPANNETTQITEFVLVIYDVYQNGSLIGEAYLARSRVKTAIFSGIRVADQIVLYVYEKGHCEKIIVDNDELSFSIQDYNCVGICTAICARGIGAYLGACTAYCISLGPGLFFCDALCGILVIVGCLVGCGPICDII
jgi:hypothetical protein